MNIANALFAAGSSPVTATLVRGGVETIDALAGEWTALCEAGPYDEPFFRPEWVRAYVAAFVPHARLVIATVRAAGRLVAVLPLVEHPRMRFAPRRLRSASNTHSCRFELVHDPAHADEAVALIWQVLARDGPWDVLELHDVPSRGALMRLARFADSAGYCHHAAPALTPPYVDLSAMRGRPETLLERLDPKFRANLRRRLRKLHGRGAIALTRSDTAEPCLSRFLALERSGWKGAEGSAIALAESTRAFYEEVARIGERRGTLCFYALELDGRAIAMYFGLYHRARYYLLKTAYDETLRDCSPGQLLTCDVLVDLVARGAVEFDFLGGMMDWKRDWTPVVRELCDVHVFRGAAGRALHTVRFKLRPAVGRALRRLRAAQ